MPNNLQLHSEAAVQDSISIYYPAIAQFGEASLITKHLRNFRFEIKVASINEPVVAQSGARSLIMNALQLIDWPKSRIQYANRQSLNNS